MKNSFYKKNVKSEKNWKTLIEGHTQTHTHTHIRARTHMRAQNSQKRIYPQTAGIKHFNGSQQGFHGYSTHRNNKRGPSPQALLATGTNLHLKQGGGPPSLSRTLPSCSGITVHSSFNLRHPSISCRRPKTCSASNNLFHLLA